jgi:hypothetical protein
MPLATTTNTIATTSTNIVAPTTNTLDGTAIMGDKGHHVKRQRVNTRSNDKRLAAFLEWDDENL